MVVWAHAARIPTGRAKPTRTSRVVLVTDRIRPIGVGLYCRLTHGGGGPSCGSATRESAGRPRPVASRVMSTADEKPMSGTTFLVMTVLMVLGALFLLRWFLSTVAFLFNTLILVALVAGAVFLFVKARGRT